MQTFEACFQVLERGEAIGIFPEGITHDDPQLKPIKSGPARMALELEHRHGGKLGLQIVPVGLTFRAKDIYRSDVLVHFGEPILASEFLSGYPARRRECIDGLSQQIEQRIQSLIVHLCRIERGRVVEAVKRLYLERLVVSNRVIHEPVSPRAEELLLTQAIANAVEVSFEKHPERAAAFVKTLDEYERRLSRLKLTDRLLASAPNKHRVFLRTLASALLVVVGAPIAAYGWIHRWAPYLLIQKAVKRADRPGEKTHISTASILAGVIGFGLCYGLCIAVVHHFFGWPVSLWYALSLPVASLIAHYYVREVRHLMDNLRAGFVLMRAPLATERIVALRAQLIDQIEAQRRQIIPASSQRWLRS